MMRDPEADGRGLILVELLELAKKFSWRRYREDLNGFLLAWAFVGALMLLLVGIAKAETAGPTSRVQGTASAHASTVSGARAPKRISVRWSGVTRLVAQAPGGEKRASESRSAPGPGIAQEDARYRVRGVNTPVTFAPPASREAWRARADYLRKQILMAAGLWPMPERTPLNPHVFDRLEHEDYTVEKVYFESYPGFYCTGNLFRPRGKNGPFPAVWSPHGHWSYGRLENSATGSVIERAINLARQGYVVFTPDMVGYNDSTQIDHQFGAPPVAVSPAVQRQGTGTGDAWRQQLWGVNVLGLQLWNSIRGIDFLQSLPDVDPNRIVVTGASGGATQTFLVTAVDDRVTASAPVNMISSIMQGGSNCENTANLRLDTNNMEIGALAAPRPLLMVAATGDWTRNTPTVEFPAVQSVYRLLGAPEAVTSKQFHAPHNYNQDSRETMYQFFGRVVLGDSDASHFREHEINADRPAQLLVFYGRQHPGGVTEQTLFEQRVADSERQLNALKPTDAASLAKFLEVMGTALQHSVAASMPASVIPSGFERVTGHATDQVYSRPGKGDRVWVTGTLARTNGRHHAVLLIDPNGAEAPANGPLAMALQGKDIVVLTAETFHTGRQKGERKPVDKFFTTYNRTDDAERVQDILTALAGIRARGTYDSIDLVGLGRAGLWVLLARALAPPDAVRHTVADAAQFDTADDEAYINTLFIPLLRRAGDFRTATTLIAPSPLMIHNTGGRFKTDWAENAYRITGQEQNLQVRPDEAPVADIVSWLQR